jgi:hypothetical protein
MSVKSMVVRMYTGGISRAVPTPLENRVAQNQHAESGSRRAEHRPDPVDGQPQREAPFAAHLVGELAARDHESGHDQQEQGDADLHPLDGRVEVVADVVDHDVHVRTREAAR